jgi:putative flavoprotein involved in K+ transport
MSVRTEQFDTVVVGGGQSGLAVGYHLKRRFLSFVILDAHRRIGDAWRTRWDSLRLFTPASHDGLPGMRMPGPRTHYPSKDEMADFLEAYAHRYALPVRTSTKVDALAGAGDGFMLSAGDQRFWAENVVIAMSSGVKPRIPDFATDLDADVVQLHAAGYRNPAQLQDGDVLVVGAGNSGAEIALELVKHHTTLLSGRDVGHIPVPINRVTAATVYPIVRFAFHRLLTTNSRVGRRTKQHLDEGHGLPLVRVKPHHLARSGVRRLPRTVGVSGGLPLLEDGTVADVANVIWCTGLRPDFSWIDVPAIGPDGPDHRRGVVADVSGLYFVGLDFLSAASSGQINGVGRDARHVADAIAGRERADRR